MKNIWLIGTGPMAVDYVKVLKDLEVIPVVIGRGVKNIEKFKNETGISAIIGGHKLFLESKPAIPDAAIIAVSIENLSNTCIDLLEFGVKKILLEKPGVGNIEEINLLKEKSDFYNAEVLIAYNRRFYTSVIESEKIIKKDGGATSFHFEFTEWSHQIKNLPKHKIELQNWFLGNSTHVIDTAFFICGRPKEIVCFHNGSSNWHPKSINFVGAGVSEKNEALFSYEANWEAPGRWNLDIMTREHRLIFKPMEKLQIQNIGSVNVKFIEDIDYSLDEKYKPGLYLQTKAFLANDFSRFCNVNEQFLNLKTYRKISGY